MGNPHQVAQAIADRTVRAWSESFAGSEIGIPLGVVAALTLIQTPEEGAQKLGKRVIDADDDEIANLLSRVWCFFTILRPELAMRCGPFGEWLDEEPRDRQKTAGAASVARSVVKAGLFDVTLGGEAEVDVLGHVHQELASKRSRQSQGQFYTPAEVAEAIARMSVTGVKPGQSICDPAAGTGGLLRAAAAAVRANGGDPHEVWWYACDIDPVAVAALAVNFHLWGLGPRVVVGRANTLVEPDWDKRAREEQLAAIEANDHRFAMARLLVEARSLFGGQEGPEADDRRRAA